MFKRATYYVDRLTVQYEAEDGRSLFRTGGTLAWRFNNPGNIRPAKDGRLIMGAIGIGTTKKNDSFLIFSSYEAGRAQKKSLLRRVYNERTIYTMLTGIPAKDGTLVMGYAPKTDKNDPLAYANFIRERTGFPIDTVISSLSDDQLDKVMDAMEVQEGFHGKKKTRAEKWTDGTDVTISDGTAPVGGLKAQVRIGDKVYEKKTNAFGQLPKIFHIDLGAKVEIHLPDLAGNMVKRLEFVASAFSGTYVLYHALRVFEASTQTKKPASPPAPSTRAPLRYTVQPDDTLPKIATLFSCSVASIMEHNPWLKDINKIHAGQVLNIYGKASVSPQPNKKGSRSTKPARAVAVSRTKEGIGQPLALLPAEQRRAPWMSIALDEATKAAGKDEAVLTTEQNYHKGIGPTASMVEVPWCASFANFCLKSADVPYEPSRSSQFPCTSKKFIKIDRPIYGAIMVMRNYVKATGKYAGTGHVTLVYGRHDDSTIVGLGGNQDNRIRFSGYATTGISSEFTLKGVAYQQKFHAYYIPITYTEFAKQEKEVLVVNYEKLNLDMFGIKPKPKGTKPKTEGTR